MKEFVLKYKKWILTLTILICILSMSLVGGILAKYIDDKEENIEVSSSKFYFTVDLLGDTNDLSSLGETYDLYGGDQKAIDFNVQNYFDELRINKDNVTYNVSIKVTGTCNAALKKGDEVVSGTESVGNTITGNTKKQDKFTIIMDNYSNDAVVEITVKSTAPYTKTMIIKFILHTFDSKVQYYINDNVDSIYAELIIIANVDIPLSTNYIEIDWSQVNASSNALQVDSTNLDITVTYENVVIDEVNYSIGKSAKVTKEQLYAGEAISILFFKQDITKNYSHALTNVSLSGNTYTITITQ